MLRKLINPTNETRVHLAHLIGRVGGQFDIGRYTYGRPKVRFPESEARLTIGRYGSIADGIEIMLGGNHRTDWVTTYPFPAVRRMWPEADANTVTAMGRGDVVIGHDVWLGSQALVLSGVKIGHGAVVAARAVVTRDVDPYTVVAGNPARVIRMRFSDTVIARLLASEWWTLPRAEVVRLMPLLLSSDVLAFLKNVEARR
ncbi:MAG: CatB-related O-acetyltransferase [Bosea sp. (in: a-proteobacteria)]